MSLERDLLVVSNSIATIVLGILVAILLYVYLRTRLATVLLMFFSLFFLFFANITQTLPMILSDIPDDVADMIILTSNLLFAAMAGTFILFFDQFSGSEDKTKLVFTSVTLGAIGSLYLAAIISKSPDIIYETIQEGDITLYLFTETFSLIFLSMLIALIYWAFTSIRSSEENAMSEAQLAQIRIMKIGFGIMGIGIVFGAAITPVVFATENYLLMVWGVFIIQRFVLSCSLAIIAYGFMSARQVIFLQPQKLEVLLVIEETGIPLFRYDFIEIETAETGLVSGAITAISALMQEAIGTRTNVKSINFFDKQLIIQFKENIAAVLITSTVTPFLNSSLVSFAERFIETFHENLKQPAVNLEVYSTAESLLMETFGFAK